MLVLWVLGSVEHDPVTCVFDRALALLRDLQSRRNAIVELCPLKHIFCFFRRQLILQCFLLLRMAFFVYLLGDSADIQEAFVADFRDFQLLGWERLLSSQRESASTNTFGKLPSEHLLKLNFRFLDSFLFIDVACRFDLHLNVRQQHAFGLLVSRVIVRGSHIRGLFHQLLRLKVFIILICCRGDPKKLIDKLVVLRYVLVFSVKLRRFLTPKSMMKRWVLQNLKGSRWLTCAFDVVEDVFTLDQLVDPYRPLSRLDLLNVKPGVADDLL